MGVLLVMVRPREEALGRISRMMITRFMCVRMYRFKRWYRKTRFPGGRNDWFGIALLEMFVRVHSSLSKGWQTDTFKDFSTTCEHVRSQEFSLWLV